FDIVLIAHGWALKHWHFGPIYTVDEYIRLQTRHVLNALLVGEAQSWA
ncbi:TetR/AcrR family transcriptional regulator, partial [Mycobacterium sp. THU-M104]